MATLTGKTIANTYKDLLQVSNNNSGVDTTMRTVSDGEGTNTALELSNAGVNINGTFQLNGESITVNASAINNMADIGSATGIIAVNSGNVYGRTLTAGTPVSITNANGAAGNPTITLASIANVSGSYGPFTNFGVNDYGQIVSATAVSTSVSIPTVRATELIAETLTLSSNASIVGNLNVDGTFIVDGIVSAASDVAVSGSLYVTSNISVTGNTNTSFLQAVSASIADLTVNTINFELVSVSAFTTNTLTVVSAANITTGSAGSVTASTDADELVLESSGNTGMSILAAASGNAQIYFGEGTDNDAAFIQYNGSIDDLILSTTNASSKLILKADAGVTQVTFDGAAGSQFAEFANDIGLKSDSSKLYFGADNDVHITHTADVGLTLNKELAIGGGSNLGVTDHFTLDVAADKKYVRLTLDNNSTGGRQFSLHSVGDSDGTVPNSLAIYDDTAAAWRARIDSTGVSTWLYPMGVISTNPAAHHANADDLVVGDLTGSRGITIAAANNATANIHFTDAASGAADYAGYFSYDHGADAMRFGAGGGEKMRLTTTGRLGVGQTDPQAVVDIVGNSDTVPALKIGSNTTHGWEFYELATGGHLRLNRVVSDTSTEVLQFNRSTGDATFAAKVLVGSGATGSIGGSLEVITGSTGALGTFGGGTGDELYIMNSAAGIVGFQTNSADTLESKSNTISFIDQNNAAIATFTGSTATFAGDIKMSAASGSINFTDTSKGIYYDGNELVMFTTGADDFVTLNGETYVNFKVNSLDLMRLLPTGLHIGGTAALANETILQVTNSGDTSTIGTATLALNNTNTTAGAGSAILFSSVEDTGANRRGVIEVISEGTQGGAMKFSTRDSVGAGSAWDEDTLILTGGNATFAGAVGVGIAPDSTYALKVSKAGANSYQQLYGATGYVAEFHAVSQNASGTMILGMDNGGSGKIGTTIATPILFQTGGSEKFRLTPDGDIGLGTASPSARLQIEDGTDMKLILSGSGSPNINLVSSSGDDFLVQNHAGLFRIYNNIDARQDFAIDGAGDATFTGDVGATTAGAQLLVGHSSYVNTGTNAYSQIHYADKGNTLLLGEWSSTDASYATLRMLKSASSTIGTNTIVANNEYLGAVEFNAADGTDFYSVAATIRAYVDGTPGASDMPGRLEFGTTADGADTSTARMIINSSGNVHIGGTSAPSTKLLVTGDAEFTQALNGSAQIVRVKNNHVGNSSPARLIIQTRGWTDSDAIINLDAAATNARWTVGADAAAGKFIISNADKNNFDGSDEVFVIDGATGDVGINTSSVLANSKFEINGAAATTLPTVTITADAQTTGWRTRRTGGTYPREWYVGLRSNATHLDTYDNTGNALMTRLTTGGFLTAYGGIYGQNGSGNAVFGVDGTGGDIYIGGGNTGTSNIIFQCGASERARITSDSRLGVGTASPTAGIHTITEGSNYTDGSYLLVDSTNASFAGNASGVGFKYAAALGAAFVPLKISAGGTTIFYMSSVGSVFAGNSSTAYNAHDPFYGFTMDSNTGMDWAAADTLTFKTGGNERLRVTSTGLSIGHASAAEEQLDVAGDTVIRSTGANANGRYWQYVRAVGDNPTNVDIVEATFPDYCTAVIKVRVTGRGTAALNTQHYSEQTYAVSTDASTVNAQAGTQIDIDQAFTLTLGLSGQQVTVDVTGSSVGNVTAYIEILSSAAVANNI